MVAEGRIVAIVPARGGSKTIPRKNLRRFGGAPLIAWSIEAGQRSRLVDRVIVSTDDDEIAREAERLGADVPFVRPAGLAGDATPDLPVFEHALDWLAATDDGLPAIVVQIRPTSPLRPPDCVDRAVELLASDPCADSVRAVVRASQNPYKMWRREADGVLRPLLTAEGSEPWNQPRQLLPSTYWQTGHVDAIRTRTIHEGRSMSGARIKALEIDGAYACDIDTDADWMRAERVLDTFDRPLVRPSVPGPFPDVIALVVFDFDGVFTDNRVWTARTGEEWVACDRSDGLGIDQLRRVIPDLLVLSTETHPVVSARCRKLRVPVAQGVEDKAAWLTELLAGRRVDPQHVVYVGNDVNDLGCMRMVGCAVAVADAHPSARAEAAVVLEARGGRGAVRELCDRLIAHLGPRP